MPNTNELGFLLLVGNMKGLEHLEKLSFTLFGFKFSEEVKKEVKNYFKKIQ